MDLLGSLQDLITRVSDVLRDLDNELHSTVHAHILEYKRTGDELRLMMSGTSIAYAAIVAAPLAVGAGMLCFVTGGVWAPSCLALYPCSVLWSLVYVMSIE
jgi:hypothetical protein